MYLPVSFPVQDFRLCLQFTFLAVRYLYTKFKAEFWALSRCGLRVINGLIAWTEGRLEGGEIQSNIYVLILIKEEAKLAIIVSCQSTKYHTWLHAVW